jgi:ABC-2 type transport system permease protein
VNQNISARITNAPQIRSYALDSQGNVKPQDNDIFRILQPYILSIVLLLTIVTSSNYLLQSIGEEKESRTGELLLSSITADQLLQGKILAYAGIGLLQIAIWAAMGILVLTTTQFAPFLAMIKVTWVLALAFIYFILGYALFSVSIACAAAISSSAKEAQQTSSLFTMMAAMPMMLAQYIIMAPNSLVAKVLTVFPYTAPVITIMRVSLTDVPPYEIAASIGILLAAIYLVMKLAGKIFRMGMLLQGKRAGLKEIIAAAKE